MVNFNSILLLVSAVSAVAVKRQELITPAIIIQDIQSIDDGVNALTAFIKAYNGGLLQSTPIAGDIAAIHLANCKGFADAELATPQNMTSSNEIIDYVFKTVGIEIPHSVKVLESKRQDL